MSSSEMVSGCLRVKWYQAVRIAEEVQRRSNHVTMLRFTYTACVQLRLYLTENSLPPLK